MAAALVAHLLLEQDAQDMPSDDVGKNSCISDFPLDVLHGLLLQHLDPIDVCRLSSVSKKLKQLCEDDLGVWRLVCTQCFGELTSVDDWVGSSSTPTYRKLYPVLNSYADYVGVWRKAGSNSTAGALYSFRWAADGIEVVQLVPARSFLTDVKQERLCTLGPSHNRFQSDLVDGTKCVLRDYGRDYGASSPSSWSTAEAAAYVAAGGAGVLADAPLGSSPGSAGFCYELLRFMQSSVQKTRSGRRSRRSGGSNCVQPILHHFCRVPCPVKPSRKQHPHQLQGLWKGLYGPHGCELLAISYDFSERRARIVATKLTGDANVPAGEMTWQVAAAPLQQPWPDQEQQLIELRPQLVWQAAQTARRLAEYEAADEAAGNLIAAVMQQEQQQAQGLAEQVPQSAAMNEVQQQQHQDWDRLHAWQAAMHERRVVGVYKGKGRVAAHGFKNPSWVEGRLWVYADGSCGFVFVLEEQPAYVCHLIDLQRLDADL